MPAKKVVPLETPAPEENVPEVPKKKRTYVRKKKVVEEDAQQLPEETPAKVVRKRAPRKTAVKHVPAFAHEPAARVTRIDTGDVTPRVSVVIPAYNEAERIAPTLVAAHAFFDGFEDPFEIIVVDDGSTDRTAEIVERMAKDIAQLRLVQMDRNSGKGAAVARGMQEAVGDIRLFADADGSTPFTEFVKLAEAMAAGADVAFGSRAMPQSTVEPQPLQRVILGRMGNLFIQITNLPGIHDSQCGFKAFTAVAANAIFPHLKTDRWGFDVEILVLARRLGFSVKEVGVAWQDRAGSKLRAGAYLQTLWEDFRIRYNAITGAYPRK